MAKTVSAAELNPERVRCAIDDARHEPVLVRDEGQPSVWIVSAEALAEVADARGVAPDVYQHALELLAVDLYKQETLTLAQGAALAGMHLSDFIDLCSRLYVPILWDSGEDLAADLEAFRSLLSPTSGGT
jgi:hypothetical protein